MPIYAGSVSSSLKKANLVPKRYIYVMLFKELNQLFGSKGNYAPHQQLYFEATLLAPVVQWMFNGCSGVMFYERAKICFKNINQNIQ